ncbi:PhzF family phenazine biosynthesis protein [Chelatococcus asaccharovorans]|uniref:Trans-2,3-dihydro-3-hydroxyanthranilate isomerase n=1 Tax=Chelatococcus asaccharovorans TaxID=28210 RepID=A0A2V3UC04_9HYPH|nr:PhzF family phenazine biosynthesis protein [Chelatococcus asaccharovorans]MBS7704255.1 PhzF family phenazine biosynthesis protein [Chelatococcus asaccharovorans]PXW55870.1 trans-2,3-dihydro-3-hydroxyanthranilate isomerase [Chelatococcus asaccharovorans]
MASLSTRPGRRFHTLDVFTGKALCGNPLAVVLDAAGLDDLAMQAIAAEFNLSETVFVLPPEDIAHRARLRIFTPKQELPFAGHPTVGTAVLLGLLDGAPAGAFTVEERVGIVPCAVAITGDGVGEATFTLPRLPERLGALPDASVIAAALGLQGSDIGFARHVPAQYSAGSPFAMVPVASRAAVDRAASVRTAWDAAFGQVNRSSAFIYCSEPVDPAHRFYARMFAPSLGIGEDPATGSAVAAFAGAVMDHEALGDGEHRIVVEQGYAMGRPSQIVLTLTLEDGALVKATIGGKAVLLSEGRLFA